MTEKDPPLQIPLPGGSSRAPTGAVQFTDDWPGFFMRGDEAIVVAFAIRQLQARLSATEDIYIASALSKLAPIADLIERDVIVR